MGYISKPVQAEELFNVVESPDQVSAATALAIKFGETSAGREEGTAPIQGDGLRYAPRARHCRAPSGLGLLAEMFASTPCVIGWSDSQLLVRTNGAEYPSADMRFGPR
jgi:hypothetical protein